MDNTSLLAAIPARHSVRQYTSETISDDARAVLQEEIERANNEGGLHLTAVYDEPSAFNSFLAHYGKFRGVTDYLVCAGKPAKDLEERVGFWGERVVLAAQAAGLNSCWVALTYGKGACRAQLAPGEKLACVVALGHGAAQGISHKSKPNAELGGFEGAPAWYAAGIEAATLAPTATNQQKFRFELTADGQTVNAKNLGGFYSGIDLGIVKCHFQLAAQNAGWTGSFAEGAGRA